MELYHPFICIWNGKYANKTSNYARPLNEDNRRSERIICRERRMAIAVNVNKGI